MYFVDDERWIKKYSFRKSYDIIFLIFIFALYDCFILNEILHKKNNLNDFQLKSLSV